MIVLEWIVGWVKPMRLEQSAERGFLQVFPALPFGTALEGAPNTKRDAYRLLKMKMHLGE